MEGAAKADQIGRPIAQFQPNPWGDLFLNHTPLSLETLVEMEQEMEKLKGEVREKLLSIIADDPKEVIIYIDTIDRLGVGYHFEREIQAILQQFYSKYSQHDDIYENDLQYVSLKFRILRQHGFPVTCDIFNIFKEKNGNFVKSINSDVQGILNLYEASYLRVHGEKILDEAVEYTTTQLKSLLGKLSEPLTTQVTQALKLPMHRGITRLISRYHIDMYERNPSHDETLLRFSKLDFNLLQSFHQKELQDLTRWWKSLDLSAKLPFARNRIVEAYFWALGTFYEPQYALGRSIFTKAIQFLTIIDDMYDAYGLFEELELYTKAVHRWDRNCMNELPGYMKLFYKQLLDTFNEFEQELAEEGKSHHISYVRELMKAQCQSYFEEAKWLYENYIPTYEEYIECGIGSSGYTIVTAVALLGMEENVATEEAFEWLSETPKPVRASCVIARLMNDIAGHKKERDRNHIASAVECFMIQYGVSEEKAEEEVLKKVEEAWKDLNEEMLRPTKISRPLLIVILNLSRFIEVIYRHGDDDYTLVNQSMCDKIQALFIDPITV